jgi:hypothetical protein
MVKSVSSWTCGGTGLQTHTTMVLPSPTQSMAKGKENPEFTALIIKTRKTFQARFFKGISQRITAFIIKIEKNTFQIRFKIEV